MKESKERGAGAAWCGQVRSWRRGGMWGGVMLMAMLAVPRAADASTYRWQNDASGDWNVPGNWELVEGPAGAGYPNLPGDVAVFDKPLTTPRTVTIPDGATVTIGRLTAELGAFPNSLSIAAAGSGLLVFDNAGEDAVIEGLGGVKLSTPIQLAADVNIDGAYDVSGSISEIGGARNVTILGQVLYRAGNTYTGTTTILDGELALYSDAAVLRQVGSLIIGDGTSNPAFVRVFGDRIDHSADVLIRTDGRLLLDRNNELTSFSATVDELTVQGGAVEVGGQVAGATLFVATLNLEGGKVSLPVNPNSLQVSGAINATSNATRAAVIPSAPTSTVSPGSLRLTPGNHDVTVADGPQAIDFETIQTAIVESAPGASVTKRGPGVMRIAGGLPPTAQTLLLNAVSVAEGELSVTGSAYFTPFTVAANATLSGTGNVGVLTTQAGGRVSPGDGPGIGILNTGEANIAGATLAIEINGGTAGAGHDQLRVVGVDAAGLPPASGQVNVTGATLSLTGTPLLAASAIITIINNDGTSDPVTGTFAGLPEGATLTLQDTTFAISYHGGDGNDVVLANTAPITYFLSEGATGTFFDEDVLIANPHTAAAPVTMTFFLPGGGTVVRQATIAAQSRLTVDVDEIEGLENTSPSVEVRSDSRLTLGVERTMFWDSMHYGGHTANAVERAERQWTFAEGAQNGFFNTYLLLTNPGGAMTVTITFLRQFEPPFVLEVPLKAQSRETVFAGDHPQLVGRSFGMAVEAPAPITAERAMYFATTPQRVWSGGHANVGSAPATAWYHPEGSSGTFFSTFILLSNPESSTHANVTLKFLLPEGEPLVRLKTLGRQQRYTFNPMDEGLPELRNASFSTVVTSDVPIVSERAMYWNGDDTAFGEGHASSGLTELARNWVLAEGRVGGPNAYTTYVLLANPNASGSSVTVTFLRESGAPVVKTYELAPNSRFNIDVGTMVPELQNESFGTFIQVTAGEPIAVERSMYWNVEGRFWSGGTNAVGTVVPR
jgi:hypothetical protein